MKNKMKYTAYLIFLASVPMLFAQGETIKKRHNYEFVEGEEIILDIEIDAGEVTILKNDHIKELSIYLEYPEDSFDYHIDYDQHDGNIDFVFNKEHWMDNENNGLHPEIEILLPSSVILDLSCRIKAGEVDMALGDLSLKRFNLKTWAGEVEVDFAQPNRIEMRSFTINTKLGETRIHSLGNARFHHAEINNGIGQLDINFDGLMLDNATAIVDLDIGETSISIPGSVGVKLTVNKFLFLSQVNIPTGLHKNGKYYISSNYRKVENSIYLKVKPGIGDLRISYY